MLSLTPKTDTAAFLLIEQKCRTVHSAAGSQALRNLTLLDVRTSWCKRRSASKVKNV